MVTVSAKGELHRFWLNGKHGQTSKSFLDGHRCRYLIRITCLHFGCSDNLKIREQAKRLNCLMAASAAKSKTISRAQTAVFCRQRDIKPSQRYIFAIVHNKIDISTSSIWLLKI